MNSETHDIEKTTENFDAERMAEEIETGDLSERRVNVSSDYEQSKLYAQPDTPQGETESDISTTVPDEFLDMAKSIQPNEGA
jgi:hypothetical protein